MLPKLQVISLAFTIFSATVSNTLAQIRCQIGGCSGNLCIRAGANPVSTCDWKDAYACYQPSRNLTQCVATPAGNCEWKQTQQLKTCLAAAVLKPKPTPIKCEIGGCSGNLCVRAGANPLVGACDWKDSYACYQPSRNLTQCVATAAGNCEWKKTKDLATCLANPPRTKCYVGSDCDPTRCTSTPPREDVVCPTLWQPIYQCYESTYTACEYTNGACGWKNTTEFRSCLRQFA